MGLLRTLDAAANRAAEGLRVTEDYVRFVLDDRHLTQVAKELRHDLAEALAHVPATSRHAVRDTQADVGTTIRTAAEYDRGGAWDVCLAALNRAQQALRSLEEFGKVLSTDLATPIESIRYRSYTLAAVIDVTRDSGQRLAEVRLCVLVPGCENAERFEMLVAAVIAGGAQMIQLRDKQTGDRQLLERARQLRKLTQDSSTLAIINDRADIARLSRADGVHVGQDELSVKDARSVVGPRSLIGVSTHSTAQARAAVIDGANYIGVGPTFPSRTKSFDRFPGLELLAEVSSDIQLPSFAIGGISADNIAQVLATGCTRLAASGAIIDSSDPTEATADLMRNLTKNR